MCSLSRTLRHPTSGNRTGRAVIERATSLWSRRPHFVAHWTGEFPTCDPRSATVRSPPSPSIVRRSATHSALDVMLEVTEAFRTVGSSRCDRGDPRRQRAGVLGRSQLRRHGRCRLRSRATHLFEVCTEMMNTIQSIPQPVIAKVHALATAAGCQLVASCDLAIAAESAGVRDPRRQGRTVLPHPARRGGSQHRPQAGMRDGPHRRSDRRRHRRLVGPHQLCGARRRARQRGARSAVAGNTRQRRVEGCGKRGFYAQTELGQTDAYAYAVDVMAEAAISPDAQEGIAAFLEKRQAEVHRPSLTPRR